MDPMRNDPELSQGNLQEDDRHFRAKCEEMTTNGGGG